MTFLIFRRGEEFLFSLSSLSLRSLHLRLCHRAATHYLQKFLWRGFINFVEIKAARSATRHTPNTWQPSFSPKSGKKVSSISIFSLLGFKNERNGSRTYIWRVVSSFSKKKRLGRQKKKKNPKIGYDHQKGPNCRELKNLNHRL